MGRGGRELVVVGSADDRRIDGALICRAVVFLIVLFFVLLRALVVLLVAWLVAGLGGLFFLGDLGGLDDDVGVDAARLDRAAGGRVVARRRQAHRTMPRERDDRLHRTLAEGLRADQDGAVMILQRTGDDLAGRGGAAVDQHRDRQSARDIARPCVVALRFLGALAARRNDLALFKKGVGDGNRLIEQAAGVVAQIEDDSDQLVVGLLF